jgi:hypothetical protein
VCCEGPAFPGRGAERCIFDLSGEAGGNHPQRVGHGKTPLALPAAPPAIDLDTAQLDQIIGAKGAANGGVYQFNVPRRDPITEGGMMVGMPAMGGQSGRTSLPGRRLLQPFDQHR